MAFMIRIKVFLAVKNARMVHSAMESYQLSVNKGNMEEMVDVLSVKNMNMDICINIKIYIDVLDVN